MAQIHRQPVDIQPEIVKYQSGVQFVALSHVGADGLGNQNRNGLPICQLLKIRWDISCLLGENNFENRLYFWIDTLCVPRDPEDVGIRKEAIKKMNQVYREAYAVLVLDGELMMHKKPSDPFEILVRVINSGWVSRVWTFHEAASAQRFYFQFADRASESMRKITSLKSPRIHSWVPYIIPTWDPPINIGLEQLSNSLFWPEEWTEPSEGALPILLRNEFLRAIDDLAPMDD
ncbi:MAG: hypothetical protein M1834_004263 [Cirrosporium novae-zelandiae]|nr:MAG: hypothetical protein M1834_004263 [Cirrosporium novae-zelandiae]